jgi:hypothetical protein
MLCLGEETIGREQRTHGLNAWKIHAWVKGKEWWNQHSSLKSWESYERV